MILYTLAEVHKEYQKGTFKHGKFADVDSFLCLVQSYILKSTIFIFYNFLLLANHKNKEVNWNMKMSKKTQLQCAEPNLVTNKPKLSVLCTK